MQKLSFSIATDKLWEFGEAVSFHKAITKADIYYSVFSKDVHWTIIEVELSNAYADAFICLINNYHLNAPY